jgi:hypothetical protein
MQPAFFSDDRVARVLMLLLAGAFYVLVFALGRLLKRRAGIQLSWTYHVVALAVSLLAAAALLHQNLPDARELALIAIVFAVFPLNAILYRFVWPLYGYRRAGDSGGSPHKAECTCCCRAVPGCSGGEWEEVFRGWYPGFPAAAAAR